jgi:transposase
MQTIACTTHQGLEHRSSHEGGDNPFARQWVTITKEEHIALIHQANYWQAQHAQLNRKFAKQADVIEHYQAKIKDLQRRVFGKKSEKRGSSKSPRVERSSCGRQRGQQSGRSGHGRTARPDLAVVAQVRDLAANEKHCPGCGLPYLPCPALDEHNEFIEVAVNAYTRRVHRPAYVRNRQCSCAATPAVISAPPEPRLIPRSPYQVSFWVALLLSKFHYGQPTHRYLQDLRDQALPVSAGTVAGGLRALAPLFEPILAALYEKQMTEQLFFNDETRWEVFVALEGKVASRWYLWVTRSASVVYFVLDPSRSAAVPGAHFAGLQHPQVIIVCDRYSAYKKLARLSDGAILLAFCWAHVRRDFLDAGRGYRALEAWALAGKERIGELYHRNQLRLEHWHSERPLDQQCEAFQSAHQRVQQTLQAMHHEATVVTSNDETYAQKTQALPHSARIQQRKVCQSLLNHWAGLTLFVDNPPVPLDNNIAENTLRGPVTGRKNYYGSGSVWSAHLAAALFSILKTLALWEVNPRHWLTAYLNACAEHGAQAPVDLTSFIPWQMSASRRTELARPPPARWPPPMTFINGA